MKKYMLSIESLAILGILDDVLDLYANLHDLVENAYQKVRYEYPRASALQFNKLRKKDLQAFFEATSHIFFDLPHGIYLNDHIMNSFSMFDIKLDCQRREYIYPIITFGEFIHKLERIAGIALNYHIRKEKPKIPYEKVEEIFNSNISNAIEKKTISQVMTVSSEAAQAELYENSATVWVYGSTRGMTCVVEGHEIVSRALLFPLIESDQFVNLPIRYCKHCNKYFVSEKTISAFEQKYGKLFIYTRKCITELNDDYSKFDAESELHGWGYNVIANQSTAELRRAIIMALLRHRRMSKDAICRDLENAIHLFQNVQSKSEAVKKWKEDLAFVREYDMDEPQGTGILAQFSKN